ncbi:MAG: ABC transporter ATP-binding protein [Polyangiales bacterium]
MQLELDNVGFAFAEVSVLEDITLSLPAGETLALIGPSGCGKSTLLQLIGGLLPLQRGRIQTRGAPPPGCLNPLTFVFQDFALLPWRSVAGNVELALEHHRLTASERSARVQSVLALCGLTPYAALYPKQLSGGMRQRVGIARALAVKPALLLMDEPLSALDAQTRELLMEDLLQIWSRERTTTLYVTHNLAEAVSLAQRVAVLSRRPGRVTRVVEIPIPLAERRAPEHAATLRALQDELWALLKQDAQRADRDVQHV